MDNYHLARRSASHGSLRGVCSSRGRQGLGPPSASRNLHKPLRSVNENSSLLHSPGALESMLKTTTETGDIGIFSIKPVISSSNLCPSPTRAGPRGEAVSPRLLPRLSLDETRRPADHRRTLRSTRDTTSEIMSAYGSESQRSVVSTLTPSSEDPRQQSYSMTTCGSRHLPHKRSTTTLQSQASNGVLQRPRSPFPYPTRLKRPGVRPASPALTENGLVDYSRMVEIDRVSYRTVHGPYKPCYPSRSLAPPPLAIRSISGGSASPLSAPGRLCPRQFPLGCPSTRSYSSALVNNKWRDPGRERLGSPATRTSSLTSVLNVYPRMPPSLHIGQETGRKASPLYYDYSEGFDNKDQTSLPPEPLAPVPTRSLNYHRPLVLREGSEEQIAAAFPSNEDLVLSENGIQLDEVEADLGATRTHQNMADQTKHLASLSEPRSLLSRGHSSTSQDAGFIIHEPGRRMKQRGSDLDFLPSQLGRDSIESFRPSIDLEARKASRCGNSAYGVASTTTKQTTNSPERRVQVSSQDTYTIHSVQGVILRDDDKHEPAQEDSDSDEATKDESTQTVSTGILADRRSHSEPRDITLHSAGEIHSARIKLQRRSMYQDCQSDAKVEAGLRTQTPSTIKHGDRNSEKDVLHTPARNPSISSKAFAHPNGSKHRHYEAQQSAVAAIPGESGADCRTENEQQPGFYRHKRHRAFLKIVPTGLSDDNQANQKQPAPSSPPTVPLIAPQPISLARQLEVKNSIPSLMKALPPLPTDVDAVRLRAPTATAEEDSHAQILRPWNASQLSGPGIRKESTQEARDSRCRSECLAQNAQKALPKPRKGGKPTYPSESTTRGRCQRGTSESSVESSKRSPKHDGLRRNIRSSSEAIPTATTPVCARNAASVNTTVHRDTEPCTSDGVEIIDRQPVDLLSFSGGLSSAFRHVSHKVPHTNRRLRKGGMHKQKERSGGKATSVTPDDASRLKQACSAETPVIPGGRTGTMQADVCSSGGLLSKRISGARMLHLSTIGDILVRSSRSELQRSPTVVTEIIREKKRASKRDSSYGFDDSNFVGRSFRVREGLSSRRHPRLRGRIRARLHKWARRARVAVWKCTKRSA